MKISIITVVYNNADTIVEAVKSVTNQSYDNMEHIVIDGASNDGTLEILETYKDHFSGFISEPDSGIYDAMNKGLRQATGDIIGFLNADDFYANEHVIQDIVEKFQTTQSDACYADLDYVYVKDTEKIIRTWKAGLYQKGAFYLGWMPPHPTFFVKKPVYERYGNFNLNLGTAGDYEIMLRFIHKYQIDIAYLPSTIIKMRAGGVSNASIASRLKANQNDRKAWKVNGLTPKPYTLWYKPLRKLGQFF